MSKSAVFNELNPILEKACQQLMDSPWEDKNFYMAWVAQTNYYSRHTTRLLAMAGALTPMENQEMHNRFLKHAAEEKGHEKLTLLDLKYFNETLESFSEFPCTQSFYQTQYYWIEHQDPMAFFGFILYLECAAAKIGGPITKRVEGLYGPKACHFLRVHAEEDIDHAAEAIAKVEKFPPKIQSMVIENLKQSAENYANILNACAEYAQQAAKKSAA